MCDFCALDKIHFQVHNALLAKKWRCNFGFEISFEHSYALK